MCITLYKCLSTLEAVFVISNCISFLVNTTALEFLKQLIKNFKLLFTLLRGMDTCPCGPPVRVGKVQVWRNMAGTNVQFFLFSWSVEGEREGTDLCCQTTSACGDGGRSFDNTLEILVWGRVS